MNEDSCCHAIWSRTGADGASETALLCVADGMGGMEAGEVASQTAVNVVMREAVGMLWPASRSAAPRPSPIEPAESPHPVIRGMQGWPHAAEPPGRRPGRLDPAALVRRGHRRPRRGAGPQSRDHHHLRRRPRWRADPGPHGGYPRIPPADGVLTRLTADHSLVAAMVASGVISAEEAEGHPDSNKVLRSLGSQRELPESYVDGLEAAFGAPSLRWRRATC